MPPSVTYWVPGTTGEAQPRGGKAVELLHREPRLRTHPALGIEGEDAIGQRRRGDHSAVSRKGRVAVAAPESARQPGAGGERRQILGARLGARPADQAPAADRLRGSCRRALVLRHASDPSNRAVRSEGMDCQKNGAEGRTRTGTGRPTRPSSVRVYQFRHFGSSYILLLNPATADSGRRRARCRRRQLPSCRRPTRPSRQAQRSRRPWRRQPLRPSGRCRPPRPPASPARRRPGCP